MTKKILRKLCVLLTLCMLLSLIAGCASNGDANESPTQAATKSPTQSDTTTDPGVAENKVIDYVSMKSEWEEYKAGLENDTGWRPLTEETVEFSYYVGFDGGRAGSYISSYYEHEVYKALEEITNVYILWEEVSFQSYSEMFQIMISSGDYCDFIDQWNRNYKAGSDDAIEKGIIVELTSYVEEYAPNYKALRDGNASIARDTASDTGTIGSFLPIYTVENFGSMNGWMIRTEWLDNLGMEVPTTYDDFAELLRAVKVEYNPSIPVMMSRNGMMQGNLLAGGFGVYATTFENAQPFYHVDGTVYCGWAEDGFLEYLTLMNSWYQEGLITPKFTEIAYEDTNDRYLTETYTTLVTSGEVGVFTGLTTHAIEGFLDGDKLTDLLDPVLKEGDTIHTGISIGYTDNMGLAISTACKNVELAVQWVDCRYSTSDYDKFINLFVEGSVMGEYDPSTGGILYSDEYLNPTGIFSTNNYYYSWYLGNTWGIMTSNELGASANPSGHLRREYWGSNMDNAYTIPTTISMTADESSSFSDAYSEVSTYAMENIPRFINGELSLSQWDAFVEQLYSMGLQECIDAKQTALNRYFNRI